MINQHFNKVWSMPSLLAISILFGLLAALLGTGLWYLLSWIAMVIPLFIISWKIWSKKRV